MTFDFIDPGLNPTLMWWAVGISIFLLVAWIGLSIFAVSDGEPEETVAVIFFVTVLFVSTTWMICLGAIAYPQYINAIHDLKVAGIESVGFTDVSLEGDHFTASQDGEFFKGIIVEISHDRYQVLELTGTE